MFNESSDKNWKINYFEIMASNTNDTEELKKADKLKIEHFPPVIGKYYDNNITTDELKKLCDGTICLQKAKLSKDYHGNLLKTDYESIAKKELSLLMEKQLTQLRREDTEIISDEELEEVNNSDFPFIKFMTLVFSKDTEDMTDEDQEEWKNNINEFITQQIISCVVNNYITMNLYQDNVYTSVFQTPYNKEEIWDKYGYNSKGLCVVYDFKEIRQNIVDNLSKIYPILYVDKKVECDDLDYNVYNANCASLLKIQDDVGEYDTKWNYIHNYQYSETDFVMLDGNITPLYMDILDNSPVKELFSNYYLSGDNNNLMFDYKKLISQILDVLYSDKFEDEYGNRIKEIHKITDDEITVDFMKPEAIYLGLEFPEKNISNISDMLNDYDIQLFKIDKKDDKLFKKLV